MDPDVDPTDPYRSLLTLKELRPGMQVKNTPGRERQFGPTQGRIRQTGYLADYLPFVETDTPTGGLKRRPWDLVRVAYCECGCGSPVFVEDDYLCEGCRARV